MELGICNLKNYLYIKKDLLLIEDIKDILFQLNKYLEYNKYLKLSHILLYSNNINCLEIKILNYSKILNKKEESFNIYNLGKLIYYILYRKYPNNELLKVKNENLNNLIYEMLNNENYSWENYFKHPFFYEERQRKLYYENNFNYLCEKHSIKLNSYCYKCKCNICYKCIKEHNSHKIIPFKYIGFNESELKQINSSINKIEDNIDKFKTDIENYFDEMNTLKNNYNSIYENDMINNYKIYYINQLNYIGEFISIPNLINLFDININEIICEYNIKEDKEIKILSCYEESKKKNEYLIGINNEKEIRENCVLLFDENKIDFSFKYNFQNKGKYSMKIIIKKPLTNLNFMFYDFSSLTSLDLSNFNTNNVEDMSHMFYKCSSLTSLDLSYFKTDNVKDMSWMFTFCFSLTSLNLSNFNTNNLILIMLII